MTHIHELATSIWILEDDNSCMWFRIDSLAQNQLLYVWFDSCIPVVHGACACFINFDCWQNRPTQLWTAWSGHRLHMPSFTAGSLLGAYPPSAKLVSELPVVVSVLTALSTNYCYWLHNTAVMQDSQLMSGRSHVSLMSFYCKLISCRSETLKMHLARR